MPKAILEFDLTDEEYDFRVAINSRNLQLVTIDFLEYLRREIKYNEKLSGKQKEALSAAMKEMYECIEFRNVKEFFE